MEEFQSEPKLAHFEGKLVVAFQRRQPELVAAGEEALVEFASRFAR